MPLPIAHTGIGLACCLSFIGNKAHDLSLPKKGLLVIIITFLANMPDLDFLPGILIGKPNHYHHGPSHSLSFALIVASIVYVMTRHYFQSLNTKRYAATLLTAASSHTLLDYFSKDTGHPYGVPLFWPLDHSYYISPVPLFSNIQRSSEPGMAFILSILNNHNFIAIGGELLFVSTVLFLIATVRYRRTLVDWFYIWPLLSFSSAICLVFFLQSNT